MKKLLTLLGTIGLTAIAGSSVIACKKTAKDSKTEPSGESTKANTETTENSKKETTEVKKETTESKTRSSVIPSVIPTLPVVSYAAIKKDWEGKLVNAKLNDNSDHKQGYGTHALFVQGIKLIQKNLEDKLSMIMKQNIKNEDKDTQIKKLYEEAIVSLEKLTEFREDSIKKGINVKNENLRQIINETYNILTKVSYEKREGNLKFLNLKSIYDKNLALHNSSNKTEESIIKGISELSKAAIVFILFENSESTDLE